MTVSESHNIAMELADLAFSAYRKFKLSKARWLFESAMNFEAHAAQQLEPTKETEPTRSILFRSAASLALNAGMPYAQEQLVHEGLRGYPPREIKEELMDLIA